MRELKYQPDFENMLLVLDKKKPKRPVLFELFMNAPLYERLAGRKAPDDTPLEMGKLTIDAYAAAGYDYATVSASDFYFPLGERHFGKTISINEGVLISDMKSFEEYPWPDPDNFDYGRLKTFGEHMPEGMKLMVMGPGGVLENVTLLMGYDNLCYALFEEPELVRMMFDVVGSRLLKYYENSVGYDSVGMLMSNDDWGFKTQTFLSVDDMRKYVFPWHKKITEAGHKAGKPVLLHSCGYMSDVMEDIIEDMRYDGKHSYEDAILPVEKSYERWGGRNAILGGVDMDYLINVPDEDIRKRCGALLDMA